MNEETVTVKQLAEEIGQTVSNVNIQIARGHAGEVSKTSEGETSDYALTIENIRILLHWWRLMVEEIWHVS